MTDEEDDDSCLNRQFNESAVLKSIYGDQLVLLSENDKPLECIIHLWADSPSLDDRSNLPRFDLHVKCSEDYPHTLPHVQLENWKNISNYDINSLKEELLLLADSLKGEVLIHELAQHCENYLYHYDSPESCSLYEGMIQRNKVLEEIRAKELQMEKADEQRKREEMLTHIHSKQQAVRKALRRKSKSENNEEDVDKMEITDRKSPSAESSTIHPQPAEGSYYNLISQGSIQSRFLSDFEQIEKLGQGTFGEVWKVRNRIDGGQYAIKKIALERSMKQQKKIMREVQLLSCLNHENVVRYYNSWVEIANLVQKAPESSFDSDNPSSFKDSKKKGIDKIPCAEDPTLGDFDWDVPKSTNENDSDSFIYFCHGNEIPECDEESTASEESDEAPKALHLYIQMELCENSTLRSAIENEGLCKSGERVWRLFREIVEGLCHIHNQGIMHRDLKPENIFLGSNDQVKIGDFGLATTSKSLKYTSVQPKEDVETSEPPSSTALSDYSVKDVSHHVGTTFYVAPELMDEQAYYNQKVDIYSLGIIFFEMNHPPFNTQMERANTLKDLRKPDIIFPENLPFSEDSYEYRMIKMMLIHAVNDRPSSQAILSHDCLVAMKLDEGEVKEMVNRTLCNPQSKDYKFLIASCFNQKMPAAFEATYNMSTFRPFWYISALNVVEERLRTIFHHYGAISFSPPLLTPGEAPKNCVSLMTNVGNIVHATPDLRTPFARYVAQNPSVVTFKRYTLEKVFREMPVGIHPRELHECAFDIVSSSLGDQMPDVEIFAVIRDILKAFPHIIRRNCVININHSVLISILMEMCIANTPTRVNKTELIATVIRVMTESTSKSELLKNLKSAGIADGAISCVMSWTELDGSLVDIEDNLAGLVKVPEHLSQVKLAIKKLQRVIKDCELLEMPCPVVVKLQLVGNPSHYTGILFQVRCDTNKVKGQITEYCELMAGGRYDGLVDELKLKLPTKEAVRFVTGFTMNVEHLVSTVNDDGKPTVVDLLFCSLGTSVMTSERLTLLKDLWALNIKIYFSNSLQNMEEIQALCVQLGATLLLLIKPNEPGIRARLMNKASKNSERKLTYLEVVDYVSKLFKQESISIAKHAMNMPIIQFVSIDKIPIAQMKIKEVQITENLSTVMQRFSSNVRVVALVLVQQQQPKDFIKFLSSLIDPDDVMKSMEPACKRYPELKKLIQKTLKHIEDTLTAFPNTVIILYSLSDSTYKVIM